MDRGDTLVKVTSKRQVTLSVSICRKLNISQGDHLRISVHDGGILLEPVAVVDRSQAWFWTAEWQAAEREATEDIEAGRVRDFDSVDEAIDALDGADRNAG